MNQSSQATTHIRIRLTPVELSEIETIRKFLGLSSVSQTVARLVHWNAKELADCLGCGFVGPTCR